MSIDPFELLLDLEQSAKKYALPMPSQHSIGRTWQGMGFICSNHHFIVSLNELKEVIHLENITTLPNHAPWFLGVTNLRGHVLPVTDLQAFILNHSLTHDSLSKILIIDFDKFNVGFAVKQILGVQRFQKNNLKNLDKQTVNINTQPLDEQFKPYISGVFQEGNTDWYVLSLRSLIQTPQFYHIVKEVGG